MTTIAPSAEQTQDPSITLTIDGQAVQAHKGELLISAAERAGIYIPRFCYHPRMEPVGMCRMCLVEVSGPRGFSLQPACYLVAQDGQEVKTSSDPARKAQEGVIEFLLVNHPLDCPVCDKGGECPLQDQSVSHGPGESRFIEEKRHWAKPIDIGPFVALDRERCIQCARCTRFADEIAGDAMIDFAFRGDHIEVAPFPALPFTSYFSGNTVQICPVGALTSRPYRFKSRPWDLEQVETTCTTCSVGCRMVAQSSAGTLVRYLGVDSDPVNQSWLCDKGRYGYEAFGNGRLTTPAVQRSGELVPTTWQEALNEVASKLAEVRDSRGPEAVAVIGGARLTNEDAYAWAKLTKSVIGSDSIDAQLGDGLPAEIVLGLPRATIEQTLSAPVVITLAPDLREELPVLFLRLRKAAQSGAIKLIECAPVQTSLSEFASARLRYLPGESERLARALVGSGAADDLTNIDDAELGRARDLIEAQRANGVVVVLGRTSLAESGETLAQAASVLHGALPGVRFLSALRRANVHGALDMGLAPGILPGRVSLDAGRSQSSWSQLPEGRGRDTRSILQAAARGEIGALILLGADPLADFPDRSLVDEVFEVPPFIVAIGTHRDSSNARADVVLPVAGEGERQGSTTNLEGRVTRVSDKVVAPGVAWPAWVVAHELARRLGSDLGFDSIDSITEEISQVAPSHRGLAAALHGAGSIDGALVPISSTPVSIGSRSTRLLDPMATPGIASVDEQGAPMNVGRAVALGASDTTPPSASNAAIAPAGFAALLDAPVPTRLDSYSLRLVLERRLYDSGTLVSNSPSFADLAEQQAVRIHPAELTRFGISDGDRLQLRSAKGSVIARAHADERVARNLAVMLASEAGEQSAYTLVDANQAATDVRVETLS